MPPASQQQPITYKEQSLQESGRRSEQSSEQNSALIFSDINAHQLSNIEGLHHAEVQEEEMDNLLKTGAFTKEMMGDLKDVDGEEAEQEEAQE